MIGHSQPHFRRSERHSWRSKPSFTVWSSESSFIPRVQSHHIFNLAFKAISQPIIQSHHFLLIRHLEPHSQHLELSFSFHSVFRATLLAFRIVIFFQFSIQGQSYHSKPLSSVLGVQSHVFSLAFRATIFFNLAFRAVSSFWHSESLSRFPFRATIFLQFWHSELSCILIQAFRVTVFPPFGVQSCFSPTLSSLVMAPGIPNHWHCTSCLHDFTFVLIFLTSLPRAYRLFIAFFQASPSPAHDIVH